MQIKEINQMLANPSQVAWACRRGMLELDIILNQYFKEAYPELSHENKIRFITLLNCNDMELFAWLIQSEPIAPEHADMIKMIGDHARFRLRS